MNTTCPHNKLKLCNICKDKKPYVVFTMNGYVYGPGYSIESEIGKHPYWAKNTNHSKILNK